jgi:hypothetical protein
MSRIHILVLYALAGVLSSFIPLYIIRREGNSKAVLGSLIFIGTLILLDSIAWILHWYRKTPQGERSWQRWKQNMKSIFLRKKWLKIGKNFRVNGEYIELFDIGGTQKETETHEDIFTRIYNDRVLENIRDGEGPNTHITKLFMDNFTAFMFFKQQILLPSHFENAREEEINSSILEQGEKMCPVIILPEVTIGNDTFPVYIFDTRDIDGGYFIAKQSEKNNDTQS